MIHKISCRRLDHIGQEVDVQQNPSTGQQRSVMTISGQRLQFQAPIQASLHLHLQSVGGFLLRFSRHIAAIKPNLIDSINALRHDSAAQAQEFVIDLHP